MIIKPSLTIKSHSTSNSLEATIWDALNEIAKKKRHFYRIAGG